MSPMKRTPTCRFLPTCSEYAIEAVHARGIVVGGALADVAGAALQSALPRRL